MLTTKRQSIEIVYQTDPSSFLKQHHLDHRINDASWLAPDSAWGIWSKVLRKSVWYPNSLENPPNLDGLEAPFPTFFPSRFSRHTKLLDLKKSLWFPEAPWAVGLFFGQIGQSPVFFAGSWESQTLRPFRRLRWRGWDQCCLTLAQDCPKSMLTHVDPDPNKHFFIFFWEVFSGHLVVLLIRC